ncbi:MAG: hypothetical protein KGJ53_07155 [Alphaproteobacteria bacterium]|nr:hypothetical protein [Alphaproteobacteria bacterium]
MTYIILSVVMIGGAQAAPPQGTLKLCREADLVDDAQRRLDSAHIRLPTALFLDDFGRADDPDFDHRWPLTIITLKPADMPPHVRCVIIPAIISPMSKVQSVAPSDHRVLEIDAVGTLDGKVDNDPDLPPSWDWTPNIHATVSTNFH